MLNTSEICFNNVKVSRTPNQIVFTEAAFTTFTTNGNLSPFKMTDGSDYGEYANLHHVFGKSNEKKLHKPTKGISVSDRKIYHKWQIYGASRSQEK